MDTIKYYLGGTFSVLFPAKTMTIYDSFTIPDSWLGHGSSPAIERLIRFYLSHRVRREEGQAPGKLEEIHRNFWAKTEIYFGKTKNRAEEVFIPANADVVQSLAPLLAEKEIGAVCEFGTGDGKWLHYLSQEWTAVSDFIGIDISARQSEKNRRRYPQLTFHHSDLLAWTKENAAPRTLYHTNGGVLEYLSEESVRCLFDVIKTQAAGSLVFLNEPLHGDFDIEVDTASKVIGNESSYTHNYVHLLQAAGAQILYQEERFVMNYRWLLVLAHFAVEA